MSTQNIKVNRINAQVVGSNFFQCSNLDVTNIETQSLSTSELNANVIIAEKLTVLDEFYVDSSFTNTSVGYQALNPYPNYNNNNSAFGYQAGYLSSDPDSNGLGCTGNVMVGYQAGIGSTGSSNILIGSNAGQYNNGNYCIAIGENAMQGGNYGNLSNIAIGANSLFSNTQGRANIGIGYDSLNSNINGENNIAIGYQSMSQVEEGQNVAIGNYTLLAAGYNNVAVGMDAGSNIVDGNNNVFVGYECGSTGSVAFNNVFIGSNSGMTGSAGVTGSVCLGYGAGAYNSGDYNTILGYNAGQYSSSITTGNNLICIGADAEPSSSSVSNECTIYVPGGGARFAAGESAWTFLSDMRDKTDIQKLELGLNVINQIQPSVYRWDRRENYVDGLRDGSKKDDKLHVGFIAQQLDEIQQKNNAEYLNLVYKSNPDKLEIATTNLIPIMIKAIQELSSQNNNLLDEIINLKKKISELEK